MSIAITILSLACMFLLAWVNNISKRMANLQFQHQDEISTARMEGVLIGERRMQPAIEQARHIGWNEGREYQIALEKRRHPRDPKTKQFVKRSAPSMPTIVFPAWLNEPISMKANDIPSDIRHEIFRKT